MPSYVAPSITSQPDPEDEFQRLYIASEAGEAVDNRDESLTAAGQLLDLVEQNRERFGARHAPQIGNVAINAEKYRSFDLATRLYELAYDLDPEHSNNIQNYVDFIVRAPMPALYDRAEELLEKLKTGKHQAHRPERTLELETRLSGLRGQAVPADAINQDEVDRIIQTFLADPSSQRSYLSVMTLLDAVHRYDLMDVVSRARYAAVQSEEDRYIALRGFADLLAASPDERNELVALDLYRYLLRHYTAGEAQQRLPELRHNYASLLYKHDYDDEAGSQWYDAYLALPGNTNIRRAYSLYLLRAGRPDLAKAASEGLPLTEQVLQPSSKPLPARFSEGVDRWWEAQPLGPGQ